MKSDPYDEISLKHFTLCNDVLLSKEGFKHNVRRIMGRNGFSDQLRKAIVRYKVLAIN